MTYPRTFSHIGISVTDLEQAVEFYTKTFGWYVIMPPTEIVADDSAIGVMCNDVFGEGWGGDAQDDEPNECVANESCRCHLPASYELNVSAW